MRRILLGFVLLAAGCLAVGCSGGGGFGSQAVAPATGSSAALGAPANVAAAALAATYVRVTWQDNSLAEVGFRIERAVGTGSFVTAGTVAANAVSFDDAGALASTPYLYRVVAFDGTGSTLSVNQAMVTTPAPGAVRIRKPIGAANANGTGYYDANGFMGYIAGTGYHLGEDWNGNGGGDTDLKAPVYAVAYGIVRAAKDFGKGWGNCVAIEHDLNGEKYVSWYAHLYALDPALPAVGGAIAQGTVVGGIGKGYQNKEYAAHLHFEFRKGTSILAGPGYVSSTVTQGPQGQRDPTPYY